MSGGDAGPKHCFIDSLTSSLTDPNRISLIVPSSFGRPPPARISRSLPCKIPVRSDDNDAKPSSLTISAEGREGDKGAREDRCGGGHRRGGPIAAAWAGPNMKGGGAGGTAGAPPPVPRRPTITPGSSPSQRHWIGL